MKTDQEIIDLIIGGATRRQLAKEHGVGSTRHERLYKLAAIRGFSPEHDMNKPVPEGFKLARHSQYYDKEGKPTNKWVIAKPDQIRQDEMLRACVSALVDEIPKYKPIKFKGTRLDRDIIPWFNIGDAHIGALASEEEILMDNDISITEAELMAAMTKLIDDAPATERCVINDIGDATHYQTNEAVTESGHKLDYDTRYYKMMRAYARVMRSLIEYALTKYKYVDVIINQGNHSRSNDIAFREFCADFYRKEKRLCFLPNSNVHIPYRMGNAFIVVHHGDKTRGRKLADVMAHDYSNDFGEARFKYAWSGHVHHSGVRKDDNGVISESFGTMSRGDKYAHDGGWRNRKCMTMVKMSKTYGELGRDQVPIEMVIDIVNKSKPGTYIKNSRPKVHTV